MTRVSSGQTLALSRGCVYLSPLARRCRFVDITQDPQGREVAHFVYDTAQAQQAGGSMADGFMLAAGNWRFMRKVG